MSHPQPSAPRPDPGPGPWGRFLRSFVFAGRGVARLVATQRNARVHLGMTAAVVTLAGGLGADRTEWAVLALAIGLVWAAEAANTALELTLDALHPGRHPAIGAAKDVAAGGVLLAAVAAAAAGLVVLLPRLWALIPAGIRPGG